TQFNSVDPYPTDLNRALAGAQDNGTMAYGTVGNPPSLAWQKVDPAAGTTAPTATGVVRYDPKTPTTAYAVRDGKLWKTTNGGTTWANILPATLGTTAPPVLLPSATLNTFPLVVDSQNPSRLLIGGYT